MNFRKSYKYDFVDAIDHQPLITALQRQGFSQKDAESLQNKYEWALVNMKNPDYIAAAVKHITKTDGVDSRHSSIRWSPPDETIVKVLKAMNPGIEITTSVVFTLLTYRDHVLDQGGININADNEEYR